MAEVKQTFTVLIRLLAHAFLTAVFVVAFALLTMATASALERCCTPSENGLCRLIWTILEVPLFLGIAFVVLTQILNQANQFSKIFRVELRAIVRTMRGLRQDLGHRRHKRRTTTNPSRTRTALAEVQPTTELTRNPTSSNEAA